MSDDSSRPIVIKRIKKGGGGHHGGAWKLAYADFVTAMMAFFLVMWLLNATDQKTREAVASYFNPIKLAEATVAHFADEEAYMASVAFPDLKSHKLIHQKLLTDFTAHKARFDAGHGELEKGFFDFLSLWLRSHICHVDAKYNPRGARKAG